ncbi:zinc-dependent metalloprotease [Isosphaeraceae bacterium EP7]
MKRLAVALGPLGLALSIFQMPAGAQETAVKAADVPKAAAGETNLDLSQLLSRGRSGGGGGNSDPSKFRDFNEVTSGSQKFEGLFTLHKKDDHLYAEIKPFQFEQPMLAPITIARGLANAGMPMNFGEEWVVLFKRVGDRVQLVRRNIYFKAAPGSSLEKAVRQNYTDSILMALPIVSLNPAGQSVLIDLSDIFLSDFGQLGLGGLDRSRSSIDKVKAFANNIEIEVEATFTGRFGGDAVVDSRGTTVVIHYGLVKLPDGGYRPRVADDRIGHFISATKDFSSNDPDTTFVRYVNRWRLEKADPRAKLSPPKRQIIWYVEDTVPIELRPHVEEGILEWNKAFEKAGIRNAIAVRWVDPTKDEFDPEDMNYCTLRWITTPRTFAMSCFRANPLTGEIIDGDVIFDASWVRYWKDQFAVMTGNPLAQGANGESLRGEIISPILAAKMRYGRAGSTATNGQGNAPRLVPSDWTALDARLADRMGYSRHDECQMSTGMQAEMGLAALILADGAKPEEKKDDKAKPEEKKDDKAKPEEKKDDKEKEKEKKEDKEKEKDAEAKQSDEFIGALIKEVVMHEVGHSLGLRHNFKASTMLNADQLNDEAITRVKGQSGSVMDYNPVNFAPRGKTQGEYVTSTLGPYDYWVIEYAYKQIDGSEESGLKKIAARAPEHDLTYGTDEDMYLNNDPLVNVFDLGADPSKFARERIELSVALMKELDAKAVKDGESWTKTRRALSVLLDQWGNAATLISSYVGGQSVHRDHKGDKDGHDPIVPVSGAKQREALSMVVDQVLSDKAFQFNPALLRRLGVERWSHWGSGNEGSVEFPVYDRVLAIQKIALGQCLSGDVLARLQVQELQSDPGSAPLTMSEVFRALTDGIYTECQPAATPAGEKPKPVACSTIRRNLQREYLRRLATMVLGARRNAQADVLTFIMFGGSGSIPADARSLARMHLKQIGDKIQKSLDQKDAPVDDTTRAHFEECLDVIKRVSNAGIQANEP